MEENEGIPKVKDIADARAKRYGEKQKKKTKTVRVFQAVSEVINRHPFAAKLPAFPHRYRVYSPAAGTKIVLRDVGDESIVEIVPQACVAEDIVRYCKASWYAVDDYNLNYEQALSAVRYWMAEAEPIAEPRPFGWPGEVGVFFQRLPWPLAAGMTPTWDRLMSDVGNASALKAWIGSLFDTSSYCQQYVWAYGQGLDGKGALNRFLEGVFGRVYVAKQPPERGGGRFWLHELLGKRLVVFPDCNDNHFITSGLFKSLTGNDSLSIEAKKENAFTARLTAKYLVLSNKRPSISSELSDTRRIIFCEFPERAGKDCDTRFEEQLWREGGAFLASCQAAYRTLPPSRPIPSDSEAIESWIETVEDHFDEILDTHFQLDEKWDDPGNWMSRIEMQRILRREFHTRKENLEFRQWLERKHKVRLIRPEDGGTRRRVYRGLLGKPLAAGAASFNEDSKRRDGKRHFQDRD